MAGMPVPAPPLDGVPPSPPDLSAGPNRNPSLQQLAPQQAPPGGSIQVQMLVLQSAADCAKLLDQIGQALPAFMPVASMMQQQLKDGLRTALQGMGGSEPSPNPGMGMMSMMGGGPEGRTL